MTKCKFLIPLGVAISGLGVASVNASVSHPSDATRTPDVIPEKVAGAEGVTTQVMQYQLGPDQHTLLMKRSAQGVLFAAHGSHQSHASHGSHGSHRSGY